MTQKEKKIENELFEKELSKEISKIQARIELEKKIVSNDEYMKWLYEFTKQNPKFSDNTWLYNREAISEENYDKVMLLHHFFSGVRRYHERNLIKACGQANELFYNIKYNDKYFAIGVVIGQGAFCFVMLEEEEPECYTLYENIVNNVEDEAYTLKKEKLTMLENMLLQLKDLKIDNQVVQEVVNKVFLDN